MLGGEREFRAASTRGRKPDPLEENSPTGGSGLRTLIEPMYSLYGLEDRSWKRWGSVAGESQRRLTEQQVALGNPGTILKDVNTVDYGDNWQFEVRLEQVEAERSRLRRPKVVESVGKAPKQYPQSDW
jgi:hypothetical protein